MLLRVVGGLSDHTSAIAATTPSMAEPPARQPSIPPSSPYPPDLLSLLQLVAVEAVEEEGKEEVEDHEVADHEGGDEDGEAGLRSPLEHLLSADVRRESFALIVSLIAQLQDKMELDGAIYKLCRPLWGPERNTYKEDLVMPMENWPPRKLFWLVLW